MCVHHLSGNHPVHVNQHYYGPYAGVCHESRTKEKNIEDVASFVYAEARVFSSACWPAILTLRLPMFESSKQKTPP